MVQMPITRALAALTLTLLIPATVHGQQVLSSGGADPDSTQATAPCNNSPDLCSRAYNNITHMGAHDSAFLRDASTGNSIAGNQFYNATVALGAGIRLLQAQVHNSNGALELCHSSCVLLNAGSLESWLARIKVWLDGNRNEVITILLVNSDDQPTSAFGDAFQSSGIATYGFVPSTNDTNSNNITWPTLQAMINTNKRLVTFITSITPNPDHPYLLSEFDHVFETPYEITDPSQFGCDLDRPASAGSSAEAIQKGMLPLLNHFVYINLTSEVMIPNINDIDETNNPSTSNATQGALGLHGKKCMDQWGGGPRPVFILVDFFDRGPAVEGADALNGVQGKTAGRTTPKEATASSSGAERRRAKSDGVVALVAFLGFALFFI